MMAAPAKRRSSRWTRVGLLLLVAGIGVAVGLTISWVVWPVEYTDVDPASLQPEHRQEYLVLIGMSFARNRDLGLAQRRLATLGDPAAAGAQVVTLAEKYVATGGSETQIRALTELAYALGFRRSTLAAYLPDQIPTATWTPFPMPTRTFTPSPTATPTHIPTHTPTATLSPTLSISTTQSVTATMPAPTPSQTPTRAPVKTPTPMPTPTRYPTLTPTITPTPAPRFELIQRERVCKSPGGLIEVVVLDAGGQPRPNVELLVRWDGQTEHFFTGLKPEWGVGYADFAMTGGVEYQVVIVGLESDVAQGLLADRCGDSGALAVWQIVFRLNR